MNKSIFGMITTACAIVAAAYTANGESGNDTIGKGKTLTPEKKAEILSRSGGRVVKPNTQRGKIVFINTQKEVSSKAFKDLAIGYSHVSGYNFVCEESEFADPEILKAKCAADVAIIIVADDKKPAMLAAIEDQWAVVNVRKLLSGLADDAARTKFWPGRCQKEVLRAFIAVSGGLTSDYPNNILSVEKLSDLDLYGAFIPADAMRGIRKTLGAIGVTPVVKASYKNACQQGWAPPPTNDVQKAIWDKVHTIPTKPIKIEFDPKTDTK